MTDVNTAWILFPSFPTSSVWKFTFVNIMSIEKCLIVAVIVHSYSQCIWAYVYVSWRNRIVSHFWGQFVNYILKFQIFISYGWAISPLSISLGKKIINVHTEVWIWMLMAVLFAIEENWNYCYVHQQWHGKIATPILWIHPHKRVPLL